MISSFCSLQEWLPHSKPNKNRPSIDRTRAGHGTTAQRLQDHCRKANWHCVAGRCQAEPKCRKRRECESFYDNMIFFKNNFLIALSECSHSCSEKLRIRQRRTDIPVDVTAKPIGTGWICPRIWTSNLIFWTLQTKIRLEQHCLQVWSIPSRPLVWGEK
jgi:hypothetical protein